MRTGIRSYFSESDPSFGEIFADVAKRQRQRKDIATKELQGILDARQIYGPYAQHASKLLTDQIASIGESLDVDQQKVSTAASEYLKYHGYSEQFKQFIEDSAAAYKADNEVNMPTALAAIRDKYVKEGSLSELEKNILQGMDAEEVLLQTPGALKEDIVIKNRLDQLGKVIQELSTPGNLTPAAGAAKRYYFGMDEETLKAEFSNVMEYDAATGEVRIKNAQALLDSGIADALLSDKRVQAIVDRRLNETGAELTEDNRINELPKILQPYTDAKVQRSIKRTFVKNPEVDYALERERNNIARMRAGEDTPSDALILASNVGTMASYRAANKAWDLADMRFTERQYTRNHEGRIIDKDTGKPLAPGADPAKRGERIISPAGKPLFGQTSLIPTGIETPSYRFGRTLIDQGGNIWVEAYAKGVRRTDKLEDEDTLGTSTQQTTLSDRPTYLPFSPALFDGALRDAKSRAAYNEIIVRSGLQSYQQPIKTETKPATVSDLFAPAETKEQKYKTPQNK